MDAAMDMDDPTPPARQPQLRFLAACPRSGSTLLTEYFDMSPICETATRLPLVNMLTLKETFDPEESILRNPMRHDMNMDAASAGMEFFICNEKTGSDDCKGESLHEHFKDPAFNKIIRLLFLIRDPIRVFDSWKDSKSGSWCDIKHFISCYNNLLRSMNQALSLPTLCTVYEQVVHDPRTQVNRICSHWGVPFLDPMIEPPSPKMRCSTYDDETYNDLLSNEEKDLLEERLGRSYLRHWSADVVPLRDILKQKIWFAFDLDDTLHEFRRASTAATTAVLENISEHYGTPLFELQDEYARVLKEKTSGAFVDGRTSFEYRRERFSSVLVTFNFPDDGMAEYLDLYENTLTRSLQLKAGALGMLSLLKGLGKKIMVITEGPQDGQERTIRALQIEEYVDFLATTNHFRVTKTTGLFKQVLSHLKIAADEVVCIGDSEHRDIVPAMDAGIFTVHLDEGSAVSLGSSPPRINTLRKLEYILSYDE
ncbi:hypothetical protein S40293_00526 [Stachybotrys chartarum IBT 40293]|nr:hypothetical protein S40293_00526 [Stachybotrys chartarum IBT 40293]